MSAIFETEFFDLKDESGNVTKASTAKLILLAMADHANDEGEGAYPAIERLCRKTALSEQTIRNTFDALRYNGIISLEGRSKYGTNNHTINTKSFPKAIGKETAYLTLYPLGGLMSEAGGSNQSPSLVLPVIPESLLTIKESSKPTARIDRTEAEQERLDEKKMTDIVGAAQEGGKALDACVMFEKAFGFGKLPWDTSSTWQKFAKFVRGIYESNPLAFGNYVVWRADPNGGKYSGYGNKKIRDNPQAFMDTGWPEFELCQTTEANFTKPPTDGKGFYA